jgi:diadenylate cyclase
VFSEIGVSDIVDVIIMSFLIYIILVWFKRTRAAFVLTGILIIAAVYLVAQQFNLILTSGILQAFFAVILVALVIIFQEEIRRFFERIAHLGMGASFGRQKLMRTIPSEIENLVRTLNGMAGDRVGALIVIRGESSIMGYLEGGTELHGKVSEEVLRSIFDPHSMGHDGAVVVEGHVIAIFGAHLPLSKNFKKLGHHGTRHAAALGLAEHTDALCLIVSEENGTISYARHGDLKKIYNAEALLNLIERFYSEIYPDKDKKTHLDYLYKNYRQKIAAIVIAVLLWFVHVYGSEIGYKTITVPVDIAELPPRIAIVETDPKSVDVTFSGSRRDLYFLGKGKVKLFLKTLKMKPGKRSITIKPSNLSFPKNIGLESIDPNKVNISIEKVQGEEKKKEEDVIKQ